MYSASSLSTGLTLLLHLYKTKPGSRFCSPEIGKLFSNVIFLKLVIHGLISHHKPRPTSLLGLVTGARLIGYVHEVKRYRTYSQQTEADIVMKCVQMSCMTFRKNMMLEQSSSGLTFEVYSKNVEEI